MSYELLQIGEIAYRAYYRKAGGKSLATGADLPEWIDLPEPIREAWAEAASAVGLHFKNRTADVFYGYTRLN